MQDVFEGTGAVEGVALAGLEDEGDLLLAPAVLFLQHLGHLGQLVQIRPLASRDESEDIAVGVVDDDFFGLAHD